ncbi:hypothetical protein BWO76_02775 (plasmid) [Sinorhizobium meliloti]|nr:hypothetical protein BWO76_02775 [Sinorhizobium meliloti]
MTCLNHAVAFVAGFGPGLRFFRKGVPNLLRWTPDMNSLVVLGTTAAWGYSVAARARPQGGDDHRGQPPHRPGANSRPGVAPKRPDMLRFEIAS